MKNEKGLSLIEVLVTIAILTLATTIIYSVLFGFNRNYQQLSEKNNLDQAANIMLASIKQHHLNNAEYILSYDKVHKRLSIGQSGSTQPLNEQGISVEIKAGNNNPIPFEGEKVIPSHAPLIIDLKLINKQGQSYEIETIIKRY
ncbi:prepilin-type N-terminal cleavage/methylation domain-containing protein [Mesobacillus boroniphilus]|uniref:Prepilin-type N-terminal cleavage/methylation domain-containing protein n=1 Tax=Mesobacillus boroniphilus TaxID=308892 RepID=A0A944GWU6_9BACI|nr:prepilin-type N-terminal cleavage/methylation domain-containing protein [Mesobacillus boroniphilus]MBS8265087.1 prepilin-type N-terminal cleavage/methylation domain-containing protein [Mesobacillus boroniphilus]